MTGKRMGGERDVRHHGPAHYRDDAHRGGPAREVGTGLRRFLGGSPLAVLVKLLLLSVLAGAGMALFGLTPGQLFWQAFDAIEAVVAFGLDTFHEFGGWILTGAVVVIPLWLVGRLLAVNRS